MNILIISHMYPRGRNDISGIFVHYQVKELIKQGCDVKIISPLPYVPNKLPAFINKWRKYTDIPRVIKYDGIEVYCPRYFILPKSIFLEFYGISMYNGIIKTVQRINSIFPFDIIHAHVALPDGVAAVLLKEKYKKPLIVTIHGQDLQHTISRNKRCKQELFKVFKSADRVISVSNKLKNLACKEFGYENKNIVINNGIDLDDFRFQTNNENNKPKKCRNIISVSSLIPSKGIDLNIMAISKLITKYPEIRYLVVGSGPEMETLRRLVNILNLNDKVIFLGQLSHQQVLKHISEADIFSLPSWEEGFGIVYIEAMALGKPVLACQGEGIEDVVKHMETGLLVKPKDVDSLVESLDYLLSNLDQSNKIGETSKDVVLKKFTWEINVQKHISLYNMLLSHKV